MARKISIVVGATLASVLLLAGCTAGPNLGGVPQSVEPTPPAAAAEESPEEVAPEGAENETAETQNPGTEAPVAKPVEQEESCDWGSGRLPSGSTGDVPSSTGDDLETALIGSWQHTHINTGSGFESLASTTDIRYVFPSTSRLLYCQDVEGATTQAENAADIELNRQEIVLPSPATGYTVATWNADTMVWINHRDGSTYLLKRR